MKLPIKRKYFELIRDGEKVLDCRDAHITFVCEQTGEYLKKEIATAAVIPRPKGYYPDVLEDEFMIVFVLAEYPDNG